MDEGKLIREEIQHRREESSKAVRAASRISVNRPLAVFRIRKLCEHVTDDDGECFEATKSLCIHFSSLVDVTWDGRTGEIDI